MTRHVLAQLFSEPIEEVTYLDPGYSGHASDVWLVKTLSKEAVVRTSRWSTPPNQEFWWGCYHLFGIDPRKMYHFKANANMLRSIAGNIPAPRVWKHEVIDGREYLVVEKMPGETFQSFAAQSDELLNQFGVWLACVHSQRSHTFGNVAGTQTEPIQTFHAKLSQTMQQLVARDYPLDNKINAQLETILLELDHLPVPDHFCPVFIDLDPSQFLVENGMLSAVVDVEAYVIGPREFDFVGLEYLLDEKSVVPFVIGYSSILEPPDVSKYRNVYRYFYRLLGVQGSVDLDQWMAKPKLF